MSGRGTRGLPRWVKDWTSTLPGQPTGEPTKAVPNRAARRAAQHSKDPQHTERLTADPRGYTRLMRQLRRESG